MACVYPPPQLSNSQLWLLQNSSANVGPVLLVHTGACSFTTLYTLYTHFPRQNLSLIVLPLPPQKSMSRCVRDCVGRSTEQFRKILLFWFIGKISLMQECEYFSSSGWVGISYLQGGANAHQRIQTDAQKNVHLSFFGIIGYVGIKDNSQKIGSLFLFFWCYVNHFENSYCIFKGLGNTGFAVQKVLP